jgi:hypothetical protein
VKVTAANEKSIASSLLDAVKAGQVFNIILPRIVERG